MNGVAMFVVREHIDVGFEDSMERRLLPGLFGKPPAVFSLDDAGIHAVEKLASHADFAAEILDPDPITLCYPQFGGRIGMYLYERIGMPLPYRGHLEVFGVESPAKAGARHQHQGIFLR